MGAMTAVVPEPTRSAAPQAMSEQHTVTLESIQKRDVWRFWMLVFGFGLGVGRLLLREDQALFNGLVVLVLFQPGIEQRLIDFGHAEAADQGR